VLRDHAGFFPEMGGAGMIGDWGMPVPPFGRMGSLPLPSAQWVRPTSVRRGHAGFFPEMGGAGMIGDWVMPVSPFGGMGRLPLPSAHWAMIHSAVRRGHAGFFQKWGNRHDRGLGHAHFPFWGYGKSPPSLFTKRGLSMTSSAL